jgi:6-phosphogluconolactonase
LQVLRHPIKPNGDSILINTKRQSIPPAPQTVGTSRRHILQRSAAIGSLPIWGLWAEAARAQASTPAHAAPTHQQGTSMFAYVGSRTTRERNARGDGISVFKRNAHTGALELVQLVGDLVNPSFLALSKDGNFLYTVHGDETEVSAFKVDKATGELQFLNRQTTQGKNPVHLALDPSGRYLIVTNHIGSSLAVLPVSADGSLAALTQLVTLDGPIGPHRIEQKQSKPHFNPFDPSGRFVVVPDKGLDRVYSFAFQDGKLLPAAAPFVTAREGAGPRHVVFHPHKPLAYVVNELDSTVASYRFTPATGAMQPLQILSTLPETFTGNSRASEISIDAQGHTLYASNRGHDSIAVFRVDPESGLLRFAGADLSQGKTPRFFTLSPDGRHMYVLNEDSDSVLVFKVDQATGRLAPTGLSVKAGSPVCMVFSS